MKFERIKSILLVLLVISSIVLTVNKWFDKKLWPDGYNFFSDVKNSGFDDGAVLAHVSTAANVNLLKPSEIVVNNSGDHAVYNKSSDMYGVIFGEIKGVLTAYSNSGEVSVASDSEWNNALKEKSIYFSYPVIYDAGYFFDQVSVKYNGNLNYLKEFIVTVERRSRSTVYLYAKDAVSGMVYKHKVAYENDNIGSIVDSNEHSYNDTHYYSFELNFDFSSKDDSTVKQPIVIDPDVLINITPRTLSAIDEINMMDKISEKPEYCSGILEAFGYNASSIRRYVDYDNSMVFVENYGVLKLHAYGVLDYKSVDDTKGINLGGDNYIENMNACFSFVDAVTGALSFDKSMYREISSEIHDIKSKTYTMTFDYYVDDCRVSIPAEYYGADHAITIEVVRGNIVSYRQVAKSFVKNDDYIYCSSAIDALDKVYAMPEFSGNNISNIFMAYTYSTGENRWIPYWHVQSSDGGVLAISESGEGQQ